MKVKGGPRRPEARDVDMQMMCQMERLGSVNQLGIWYIIVKIIMTTPDHWNHC